MEILRFALLGAATGGVVALVALGVVVTFRASGVLNFAQGAAGAFSAFVFYDLRDEQGLDWKLALLVALVVGVALGAFTHAAVVASLRRASNLTKVISSLGVMILLQGLVEIVWSVESEAGHGQPRSILPTRPVRITDSLVISQDRLALITSALAVAFCLRLLYTKTSFGLATSAVAEDREIAAAGGWSPTLIELANFALAGLLGAAAAILLAPIVGLQAAGLTLLIVPALAAALAGSFASFGVTVLVAIGIGVGQAELSRFLPNIAGWLDVAESSVSGLPAAVPMLVIIAVAVSTGRSRLGRGESLVRYPLPGTGRVPTTVSIAGIIGTSFVLSTVSNAWADAVALSIIMAILLLSVVVVTGYAGQLSLAQFALAGFGAWTAARLYDGFGLPFEVCLLLGVVLTVPVGLLVALPALRTRGVTLAIATLGLALMLEALVFNNGSLTGGFAGTTVSESSFFGVDLQPTSEPGRYGVLALGGLVLAALVVANVRRGRAGRRLLAVRSNERAAASLGIGVYGAKLYAFGLGSAVAGLAGVLLAFRRDYVLFQDFNVFGSILAVQLSVIGGVGWVSGAILGAAIATGGVADHMVREVFDLGGEYLAALGGLIVIVQLRLAPHGIAEHITRTLRSHLPARERRTRSLPPAKAAYSTSRDGAGLNHATECVAPAVLECRNMTVHFGAVIALHDVSLEVHPGEVVGLIGPNGAGKTTFLDAVTGFTSTEFGRVVLNGTDLSTASPDRRARAGIGRSWQAVELFDELSVYDNLLIAADVNRSIDYFRDLVWPGRQVPTSLMRDVIDEFHLHDVLDIRPPALSNGIQHLVGIARTICSQPSILLLDEPAAGLDTGESAEVAAAIRRIADERGIGVLLVEHDVPLVLETCDRIVVLDFGGVIASGTPAEITRNDSVISAYLGDAPVSGPSDALSVRASS